jgi:hypothetical protein
VQEGESAHIGVTPIWRKFSTNRDQSQFQHLTLQTDKNLVLGGPQKQNMWASITASNLTIWSIRIVCSPSR